MSTFALRKPVIASLGTAIVAVFGAGVASAVWTTTDAADGSVTAGQVAVTLLDGSTELGQTFGFTGAWCGNMLPGDSCTKTFTVKNTGTVSESFTATATNSVSGCYTTTRSALNGKVEVGDVHLDYDPAETDTLTVTTTMDANAPLTCQATVNTVTVTVSASPSASPRD